MLYDIDLEVRLITSDDHQGTIAKTNYSEMYYSSAQQLAHHSTSGCPMNAGDLLGSGTISGEEPHQRGSLLELTWRGKDPLSIAGGITRSFIKDGDRIEMSGSAKGEGYKIGFGPCTGRVLPALENPYAR